MNKKVLGFGSDFLKSEMHSFKDSVKAYERIREKCDAAWSRFLPGLSKSKDSGVLAEVFFSKTLYTFGWKLSLNSYKESLVIEDLKKAHLKASVDMALKSKSFKVEASQFLAEIIQMYLRSQKEFHEDISAILRGVKPFVDRWNVRMDHESSEFQLMLPRIEDFKKSLHKVIVLC